MNKKILQHLQKIFSSALYGLVLFAFAVMIQPVVGTYTGNGSPFLPISISDLDTKIEPELIIEKINQFRLQEGREALQYSEVLCPSTQDALQKTISEQEFGDILKSCGSCQHLTMLSLTGTYKEDEIVQSFIDKQKPSLLSNGTHICIQSETDVVAVGIGSLAKNSSALPSVSKTTPQATSIPFMRDIPDSEVIAALNQYRADHQIPQLTVDQHLCNYAAKRAQDLVKNGGLDAHAGFKRDFENNQVPKELEGYSGGGFGENLAHQYCYRGTKSVIANTGAALIEWCFDSSTKGHREAQLNPAYNAVCVRHAENMYVVEFGE